MGLVWLPDWLAAAAMVNCWGRSSPSGQADYPMWMELMIASRPVRSCAEDVRRVGGENDEPGAVDIEDEHLVPRRFGVCAQ